MAYSQNIGIVLGTSKTGLTLKAQLVDTSGANVGSSVTSGFTEIGLGNYSWYYTSFPDSFRGGIKIMLNSDSSLLAFVAINPEDAENLDVKTSKTKLDSTGLDAISITSPSGMASTFRDMMILLYRRFFKKSSMTTSQLKIFADDGNTVIVTQALSNDGTTQTVGNGS